MTKTKGEFTISTDRSRLDLDFMHDYLSNQSYWVPGMPMEKLVTAVDHSLNFGLYHAGRQIGYARVITDYSRVAYLADVFVIEEYRGRGLAKWLVGEIRATPELQGLRRWMLHTRDAHPLYAQLGWTAAAKPENYMEIYNSDPKWWE